jgi:hypothetical protein
MAEKRAPRGLTPNSAAPASGRLRYLRRCCISLLNQFNETFSGGELSK